MSQNKTMTQSIQIASYFAILYLGLKLFIVPLINLKTGKLEIPDINPSDVGLVIVVLLFQTELPNLIRKIKIGSEGFEAEFKELKDVVDKQKEEIDILQQRQIEQIQEQQQELDSLQAFMYNFLLDESEYKILNYLQEKTEKKQPFNFHVSSHAASDLRKLRGFKLIDIKGYVSTLESESHRGQKAIDLTQSCQLTERGHKFLETKKLLQLKTNPSETLEPTQGENK